MGAEPGKMPVIGMSVDQDADHLKVKHGYCDSLAAAGGLAVLLPPCNEPAEVAAVIDGFLIPGGGDLDPSYYSGETRSCLHVVTKQRSGFELALLMAIMELGKPVFGICYGMQLMNVALGGSLYQDIKAECDTSVDHTQGAHPVDADDEMMKGRFLVNTSHHQAVRKLGQGLRACATALDGLVEGIYRPGYPFLVGVQWHPERSEDALSRHLFRAFVEAAGGGK